MTIAALFHHLSVIMLNHTVLCIWFSVSVIHSVILCHTHFTLVSYTILSLPVFRYLLLTTCNNISCYLAQNMDQFTKTNTLLLYTVPACQNIQLHGAHTHTHKNSHTHAHTRVHTHTHTHLHTHTHTHTCTHTHSRTHSHQVGIIKELTES